MGSWEHPYVSVMDTQTSLVWAVAVSTARAIPPLLLFRNQSYNCVNLKNRSIMVYLMSLF